MKLSCFILLATSLAVVSCMSLGSAEYSEEELLALNDFRKLVDFLGDALQANSTDTLFFETSKGLDSSQPTRWYSVNKFSFNNCASPEGEQVVVNSASLKPDPLKLPGKVTVSGSMTIKKPFGTPLKMKLSIYYKTLGIWIKVPCVDGVGSCTYSDFCQMLNKIKKCPPAITKAGLKCKCPFPAVRQNNTTLS
ncbi:ganglioside GM2 activator [Elysia marginata]|uniref:Ganglioside GM2 activator n=1 Tax=Elysia marginata TaxID=1093978 RepID=A0AAV4HCQ8_9GAST|nr:ganglioside GM2 activator [Elysia marginata]